MTEMYSLISLLKGKHFHVTFQPSYQISNGEKIMRHAKLLFKIH